MNTLENEIRKAAEETAEAVLQQDICCDGQGQEEDGPAEEQEIQTVKKQLWEEKVRLEETRTVLEQEKEKLHEEQERFRQEVQEMQKEMARQNQRLLEAQKSLKKDELFFQQRRAKQRFGKCRHPAVFQWCQQSSDIEKAVSGSD